jgi:hypothetical protein
MQAVLAKQQDLVEALEQMKEFCNMVRYHDAADICDS